MPARDTPNHCGQADALTILHTGEVLPECKGNQAAALLEVLLGFWVALRIKVSLQAAGNTGPVFRDPALTSLGLHLPVLPKGGSRLEEASILGQIDLETSFCH